GRCPCMNAWASPEDDGRRRFAAASGGAGVWDRSSRLPGAMALETHPARRLTPTDPDPLVTFLVPAYDEAASLEEVLRRVYDLPLRAEVIAVDDGSTDDTPAILEAFAESHGLIALRHERNRGKGAAVRTALARSTG